MFPSSSWYRISYNISISTGMSGHSSSDSPGRRTQWYVPSRMVFRCERLFLPTSSQIEHLFLNLVGLPASSMHTATPFGRTVISSGTLPLLKSERSSVGTSIGLVSIRSLSNIRSTIENTFSSSTSIVIFMSGSAISGSHRRNKIPVAPYSMSHAEQVTVIRFSPILWVVFIPHHHSMPCIKPSPT